MSKCAKCGLSQRDHCDFDEPGVDHPLSCEKKHHTYVPRPPVRTPMDDLVFVQRRYLDLLADYKAIQAANVANMATATEYRELLQAIRPVVAERKLAAMCESSSDEHFRFLDGCLKRIDVALGLGGAK